MELIIKPTGACNFKCTFCSSTDVNPSYEQKLSLSSIEEFLVRFPDTTTIIVNGGEPLMMPPSYYLEIIKILDNLGMDQTTISFTSNLWIFYRQPEKWLPVFRHPRVGVGTSFQYGNARLKGNLQPFTEEEFWKVSDKMLQMVGYRPDFIAVIDESNEDTVIKTVELAKKMGVVCKINYANASGTPTVFKGITIGNAGKTYPLYKIYRSYLEIIKRGLVEWEYNSQQLLKTISKEHTTCPLSRNCDSSIRTLQAGNEYFSCGAFGDDKSYAIDFKKEMSSTQIARPLLKPELHSMHDGCFTCDLFSICNGCKKHIHDVKKLNLVEKHCAGMKELLLEITKLKDSHETSNQSVNKP